jgi:hypothetical protein
LFRQIKRFLRTTGIHYHLAFAAPVTQINKYNAPHIPPPIYPARQGNGLSFMACPQRSAIVCLQH